MLDTDNILRIFSEEYHKDIRDKLSMLEQVSVVVGYDNITEKRLCNTGDGLRIFEFRNSKDEYVSFGMVVHDNKFKKCVYASGISDEESHNVNMIKTEAGFVECLDDAFFEMLKL